MNKFLMFLTAFLILPVSMALANADTGLYDPIPPEGSAFIRFVSLDDADGSKEAKVNNKSLEYIRFKDISSYFVTPEGPLETKIGRVEKDFDVKAGNFYTVVLSKNQDLQIYQDEKNNNQAKAQIIYYNFSSNNNLSLKTNDGKVEIVPAVASGKQGAQQINPVKVSLAVYDGDKMVKDLGAVSLERGHSYSVVTFPNNEMKWMASSTNTVR
ncbi:MAG: alginate O-acetyltransferase AlgF [Micavibrio sp.]